MCLDTKHHSVIFHNTECKHLGCFECFYGQFRANLDSGRLAMCHCGTALPTVHLEKFMAEYLVFQSSRLRTRANATTLITELNSLCDTLLHRHEYMYLQMGLDAAQCIRCPGTYLSIISILHHFL